ncbi:MAG: formylglycine-generating enzyme family protein [Sedimentisphaerales bacterium]
MKKIVMVVVCSMAIVNIASAEIIRGIDIDFVTIGNAGNDADNGGTVGCGAISYDYRIGKYEVTNAQWDIFTAVAGAPTGNDGGYGYSAYFTGSQQPTNMVSWYEAAQFCNYLTSGNKYSGAYKFDINGNFMGIDRVSSISTYGTTYVIPTENEWYKAAYYKPDDSGYSLYANGTDVVPTTNQACYDIYSSPWNIGDGTQEQNGTYDMMGNVWEWNETLIYGPIYGYGRGLRGDSYNNDAGYYDYYLASSYWLTIGPMLDEGDNIGFRIASIPEPTSLILLSLGIFIFRKTH